MSDEYQFTRSIGFQIQGEANKILLPILEKKNKQNTFEDFEKQYQIVIEDFESSVFFETPLGEQKEKSKLEIKYSWVKQNAKNEFYENKLNEKRIKICTNENAPFLSKVFEQWIQNNKEMHEKIKEILSQPQKSQKKESDLALHLRTIFGVNYFFFVRDFVLYAKDKNSDVALKKLKKSVENFQILLEQALCFLSPNQTTGMEVARASFNFYTVNKISKDFLKERIKNLEEQGGTPYQKKILDQEFLKSIGFEEYLQNWRGENDEKYSATTVQELVFQELYSALKDFRAKQKKSFNEAIYQEKWKDMRIEMAKAKKKIDKSIKNIDFSKAKGKSFKGFESLGQYFGLEKPQVKSKNIFTDQEKKKQIKNFVSEHFPLFDASEDTLLAFVELTEEIQKLGEEKNRAKQNKNFGKVSETDRQLKQKREKRGKYFIEKWGFSRYSKEYCNNIYKKIAMDFGKLKAEIRGMEQEKIEARLLNYWAHVWEEGDEKSLVLIPKTKMTEAKRFLESSVEHVGGGHFISFNSLTLRALDKMIRKNYPKEISEKAGNIPFKEPEEKVSCYQKALKGEMIKLQLDFSGFSEKIIPITRKKYKSIEEFRLDFEKISYVLQRKSLSKNDIEKLKNDFGAIISKITSYDLERKIGIEREHTSFWNGFWAVKNQAEEFPVRLNPEMRIFYRKPLEQKNLKKQNNRFSKEHFRVAFTLTQNAAQKELNTTFANEKDLITKIETFNTEVIGDFIQKQGENLYYFGIDRGNQELATLGVVKWTKEDYEATLVSGKVKKFPKPDFPEIEVFSIKNQKAEKEIIIDSKKTKISVKIADNPSYFMENELEIEEYFEKKTVVFIDLTTAKLIKGKIILDGDTKTYLNLKKANAKRKLFDVFTKIETKANVEFFENQFRIAFGSTERATFQALCYFLPEQEKILSKSQMQQELQKYLKKLRKDGLMQENTIEQINHLRDAITANMVGIITFLHEKYPAIINLENLLKEGEIRQQFTNNNESIARRLEWALYRKFQKKNLVPPNLKQTIFLKENKENLLKNFGIIHFIQTENSSANCPFCSEKSEPKKRKNLKWNEHSFLCTNEQCLFDTKENKKVPLTKISNSDEVAAYNIAKSL